jgi:hypothetical protein
MKIKFNQDGDTIVLGRVEKDDVYDSKKLGIPAEQFKGFVRNGVATEIKEKKEVK